MTEDMIMSISLKEWLDLKSERDVLLAACRAMVAAQSQDSMLAEHEAINSARSAIAQAEGRK